MIQDFIYMPWYLQVLGIAMLMGTVAVLIGGAIAVAREEFTN